MDGGVSSWSDHDFSAVDLAEVERVRDLPSEPDWWEFWDDEEDAEE